MGTEIQLLLERYDLDYGKNEFFNNHCALFQPEDLQTVPDYGYEDPIRMEGYSRTLESTVGRLELMGYTLSEARLEYSESEDELGEKIESKVCFDELIDLIKSYNVYDPPGHWTFLPEEFIVPGTCENDIKLTETIEYRSFSNYQRLRTALEGLSPYTKLRLFAENSNNLRARVIWPFGQLVENGWADREQFLRMLPPKRQFLIVTEGSSDAKTIEKALSLLKPGLVDFFRFVDMGEGYPFSGTGNLHRFSQGLVSIGVLNQVVIIYDNDAEGCSKYELTAGLNLPKNMSVMKLPDLPALERFETIGPSGSGISNINGTAASIECYLDLAYIKEEEGPRVRWSSFVQSSGRYQGALESKEKHMRAFLRLRCKDPSYDFSKIEKVLDCIYQVCVKMAECSG